MSDNIPSIEPIEPKTYEYKQSKFDVADKLPFRSIICASSQGGKGILLQNLILKIYKNCFERIYIFSPTASVDDNWTPVKRYITDHLKVDNDKEKYLFDDYDSTALQNIIDTQHKVVEYQKKNKIKNLFSVLIVIDDMAEDQRVMKYSKILHGLYTKSRHNAISVLTSVQKYNAVAPIIRLNSSSLCIFKLRNMKEVDAFIEENSALVDKHRLYDMYQQAVNFKPFSFFFIKLRSQNIDQMFYINLDHVFKVDEDEQV